MQRTIRIQLQPSTETAEILTQTIEQYTWSFNAVCRHGWEHDRSSGLELHKATYYEHRAITGLPAQLVCAARVKATEALKSIRTRKRKKEAECSGGKIPSGVGDGGSEGEASPSDTPWGSFPRLASRPRKPPCCFLPTV